MSGDRLREGLLGIIDAATRGTRYHRLVRGRVVNVLAGGNVETEPETAGTPPQPNLPLRYGLPGVLRAVVRSGARVLLGWAEGDPSQPYVAAWDPSELEELVFDVPGGAEALARTGDTADCGNLYVSNTTGSVVGYAPPGTPPVPPAGAVAIPLSGRVTGTSRVKA